MRLHPATCAAVVVLALGGAAPALADEASDALHACLAQAARARPADNDILVRWVFSAIATHPALKASVTLTDAQRAGVDKAAGELIQRLVLTDCRKEALEAVRTNGPRAIEGAFGLLGSVTVRQIMAEPSVSADAGGFSRYLDKDKWRQFAAEASPTAAEPPKP